MKEHIAKIETSSGVMETFVTQPDEGGPHPIVLFYMDAIGIREELKDMARRIGTAGYCVLLPNLFYRAAGIDDIHLDAEQIEVKGSDERKRFWGLVKGLTNTGVMEDTRPLLDYAKAMDGARNGPAGCVGYCLSGQFVYAVAGHYPQEIGAVASYYGAGIMTDQPDSPLLKTDEIRAELYLAFAEDDHWVPDPVVQAIAERLSGSSVRHRIERYPGAHHGFAFPDRHTFDKPSAERHWERMLSLFRRNLD
ncbi:MAG: dienelactone hydrolase family protein [Rhodospirillaceae bacterium]|nr:dienelactone hydrolase family protein [Rhodospirillaceae bacterium]